MIDLRVYANDLLGRKIKPRRQKGGHSAFDDYIMSKREYVVEAVYPHYVKCRTVVNEELNITETECFSVGDLVMMGLIHSVGQRESSLQAKGIREPHGHGDYVRWKWKERRWTN